MNPTAAQVAAATLALVFYTVAAFGFAYIVGHSVISLPFRQLLTPEEEDREQHPFWYSARMAFVILVECPACCSTWVGAGTGLVLRYFGLAPWWVFAPLALYTCATSFFLAKRTGLIP